MRPSAYEAVAFRFFDPQGPYRLHLEQWSQGTAQLMHGPMFRDLLSMATALVVLQRLESRHSLLKRHLAWKHKSLPMTLSAALRRRQNGDLLCSTFQSNLPDLLNSIGELHPGPWHCKAQLLEKICQSSGEADHDPLLQQRARKDAFVEGLAQTCASASVLCAAQETGGDGQSAALAVFDAPMQREHIRATLKRNKFYAIRGYQSSQTWTVFRVISTNPGSNMFLQRCVHVTGADVS